jgi:seryl-tRNA synthetase
MLDVKLLRANFDEIKKKLENRGEDISNIDRFEELDKKEERSLLKPRN